MIELVELREKPEAFMEAWTGYLASYPATYRYEPLYLEYRRAFNREGIDDHSFVILRNREVVGICFLPVERVQGVTTISLSGGYVPAPLGADGNAEDLLFEKIHEVAEAHRCAKVMLSCDPQLTTGNTGVNPLSLRGYIDTSTLDALVDLSPDEGEMWKRLRENHRRAIRKLRTDPAFSFRVFEAGNEDERMHEAYREMHHRCSGRVTRPKETFDLQYAMLRQGLASLLVLFHHGEPVGSMYFLHQHPDAAYASGADEPSLTGYPLYHYMLWMGMLHLKMRGFTSLQLGWPSGYSPVRGFGDYLDAKQLNISHFKQGFRGQPVAIYQGVLYRDAALFERDVREFEEKGKEAIHAVVR